MSRHFVGQSKKSDEFKLEPGFAFYAFAILTVQLLLGFGFSVESAIWLAIGAGFCGAALVWVATVRVASKTQSSPAQVKVLDHYRDRRGGFSKDYTMAIAA